MVTDEQPSLLERWGTFLFKYRDAVFPTVILVLVILTRPRGYFDPARDRMVFDGHNPPPGVLPGAGVSASRIKPAGPQRTVVAEFNGERVVGRTWPTANNEVSVLELTF